MPDSSCDIIIPVFDQLELTRGCLRSIEEKTRSPYRLILIDNASGDETRTFLDGFARGRQNVVLVRNRENRGWVKAVNQGIGRATSPYLSIMNNDTLVRTEGWLAGLIEVVEASPDIGLVNPLFTAKKEPSSAGPYIEIDFCRGYCILIKRRVVEMIGGLDEAYGQGYYDDDDFSVRAIRAGFRCVRANHVLVEHLRDSTFTAVYNETCRRELHDQNKRLFYERWGRRLRIVFLVTKDGEGEELRGLLLGLARRQHIVSVWHTVPFPPCPHINIRPERIARPLVTADASLRLLANRAKKEMKRYDLVFCDDLRLAQSLSFARPDIITYHGPRDAAGIMETAEKAARTS